MNALVNLLKDHQIGTWCRRAAWIIVVVYVVLMVSTVYNVTRQFGLGAQSFNQIELVQLLSYGLAYIPGLIFNFFILYAAGAIVDYFVGQQEEDVIDNEEEEAVAP
jgi:hypothetical protein